MLSPSMVSRSGYPIPQEASVALTDSKSFILHDYGKYICLLVTFTFLLHHQPVICGNLQSWFAVLLPDPTF